MTETPAPQPPASPAPSDVLPSAVDVAGNEDNVHIEVRGPDGELKHEQTTHNLVTTVGKGLIADRLLASPTLGVPTHMAIGTGTSGPAAGDTALGTEIDRNALTSKTRSGAVVTMVGDWAAGDGTNAAITEAGILNASSSGDLLVRATFGAIAKAAGDTLSISWFLTIS
jgi:hypothetical protein